MIFFPTQMLGYLIVTIIAFCCGILTLAAYIKRKNLMVGWFSGYFFFKAIGFGMISFLGILSVKNIILVSYFSIFALWIICLAPAFIFLIVVSSTRFRNVSKILLFIIIAIIGTVSIILIIPTATFNFDFNTGHAQMVFSRNLPFNSLIFGIYHLIFYLPMMILFFYFAKNSKEKLVKVRSMFFGIGILLAIIAPFVACFSIMGILKMPPWTSVFFGVIYLIILSGILYKPKQEQT